MVKVYDENGKLIYDGPRNGAPGFKEVPREERRRRAALVIQEAYNFLMADDLGENKKDDPSQKSKIIKLDQYKKGGGADGAN